MYNAAMNESHYNRQMHRDLKQRQDSVKIKNKQKQIQNSKNHVHNRQKNSYNSNSHNGASLSPQLMSQSNIIPKTLVREQGMSLNLKQNQHKSPIFHRKIKQQEFLQHNSFEESQNDVKKHNQKYYYKEQSQINKNSALYKRAQQKNFNRENTNFREQNQRDGKMNLSIQSKKSINQNSNHHSSNYQGSRQQNQLNKSKGLHDDSRISKIQIVNKQQKQPMMQKANLDESLQFGRGLQEITQKKYANLFNNFRTPLQKVQNKEQKVNSPSYPQSSTLSPQPSTISVNKRRINKRITQLEKRQTGKNLFRRVPLNITHSQEFLKISQNQKQGSKKRLFLTTNQSFNKMKDRKQSQTMSKQSQRFYKGASPQISHNQSHSSQHKNSHIQDTNYINTQVRQQLHLSLANNLNRIQFKYNGGHATVLYNNRLKIKNQSAVKVQIKIKCTSPAHYEVKPKHFIELDPSQIINITIQMKLNTHDLNLATMKHDLSRYHNDKFKICYEAKQFSLDIQYLSGQKVLPVEIEQTEEQRIRNQGLIKNLKNYNYKLNQEEKTILLYKKMIEKNNFKIQQINEKVKILQKEQFYLKYFTKTLFLFFGLFGAGLGFLMG